mmetsp:Transcript_9465/g.21655  ORF Transcript_9465/g.21655 Transcript_9465/m.21655 type:complete len:200 (-) Transcript_9465:821-1420(-)
MISANAAISWRTGPSPVWTLWLSLTESAFWAWATWVLKAWASPLASSTFTSRVLGSILATACRSPLMSAPTTRRCWMILCTLVCSASAAQGRSTTSWLTRCSQRWWSGSRDCLSSLRTLVTPTLSASSIAGATKFARSTTIFRAPQQSHLLACTALFARRNRTSRMSCLSSWALAKLAPALLSSLSAPWLRMACPGPRL